jgi:hypothetical protein
MDMSTDDAAGFKFHGSKSLMEGISVADINGTRSASRRDTTSHQPRSVAASSRVAHAKPAHISGRSLNRTIWKYVASFKVYFRTQISEKSNPGE